MTGRGTSTSVLAWLLALRFLIPALGLYLTERNSWPWLMCVGLLVLFLLIDGARYLVRVLRPPKTS
ncbi:MAG: hypothetical protein AAGD10_03700 [Myxococcota bacterium]